VVPGHQAERALQRAGQALALLYPDREYLLVSSGTAALQLALAATRGRSEKPCVALPAYACPDLGTAAIGAGYSVVLYDVNPETLQPDQTSLVAALQAGATHVIAAHLFGRLVDMPAVLRLAADFGAQVIEDAAQHAGASLGGVRGGSLAAISVLSFGRGKGLNAGGGGALLWQRGSLVDQEFKLADAASGRKQLAVAAVAGMLSHPLLYALPRSIPALGIGETRYHSPEPPRAMAGSTAVLLAAALEAEPLVLQQRRIIERWYDDRLTSARNVTLNRVDGSESGALRYPVRIDPATGKRLLSFGVARSYPRTLSSYREIAAVLHREVSTPGADELANTLHTLPTHSLLPERARTELVRAITER
jgi:dTDP-4-amino-4,6-dideoxygalactose transaminase